MDESLLDGPSACLRLDDQLCYALYAAASAVVRAYRPLLQEIGLTYPQYIVMMALWETDDAGVGDLSARLGLAMTGVTPILDRLDDAGLLERRRDRGDRRIVKVALTEAGRALEERAARAQYQVRCQTELAPDDLSSLREKLRALTKILDSRSG